MLTHEGKLSLFPSTLTYVDNILKGTLEEEEDRMSVISELTTESAFRGMNIPGNYGSNAPSVKPLSTLDEQYSRYEEGMSESPDETNEGRSWGRQSSKKSRDVVNHNPF
mmetsp:Transcript_9815/g.13787  ORF Transcript_9815/g.13787 Transcript_9815/m.13787 type:complete len:109 (+) Transcript_9815:1026-1352(+)